MAVMTILDADDDVNGVRNLSLGTRGLGAGNAGRETRSFAGRTISTTPSTKCARLYPDLM